MSRWLLKLISCRIFVSLAVITQLPFIA